MIVIGIDPGTAITGYGIIEKNKGNETNVLGYGCITTSSALLPGERLKIINSDLDSLILKHKPDFIAVESLYFFKNLKTAMPVSQAKGVILLTAAKRKIPVLEFTPLEVKMTVAGYGRAEKKQVQKMIQNFLKLKEFPKQDDAADALGVALCGILKKNSKLS
ncbi:MAG: crossover junction endodeoxyribonuclease RuvC [Candidatus Pacebacteria bacterium]|nr:crossover junction endodeoxyribonuclease RuvC [Candidatus Paceibacterota bacterium]MDD3072581.1 crossover junction endodeoxyribonuclease RuvC [Candidatus Paceibacterota bacterium]MDD3729166.1 crossover junction endodeoxyribonuclease RuvC [Candidatus Paceibacterota bacterium]MDD4201732.1 crossover junction endodeoxyribonuclease RuvC [Candidatus Paceibacterota bacterium]MDD4467237.1 crossover junction endodeoxyribonuclease RuvC [Candidatus Paceibacterota bacterium]